MVSEKCHFFKIDQIRENKRLEFYANELTTFVFPGSLGVKKFFNKLPKYIMTYLLVNILLQLD